MVPKSEVKVGLSQPFMFIKCVCMEVVVPYDPGHSLPPKKTAGSKLEYARPRQCHMPDAKKVTA